MRMERSALPVLAQVLPGEFSYSVDGCAHSVYRVLSLAMSPFNRYVRLFPPSLQWVPWPPLAGALRFPTFIGTMRLYDCSPSIHGHLRSPLAAGTSPGGRRWRALLGSWGIPFGSMPRARDSGGPVRPHPTGRPGTAFRSHNSVGVRHDSISELHLRGLLPCCVRFAPTGHPVNGNTRYRPAGSLWPGGTRTRWIPLRGFTGSHQLLLFQAFLNAICG